MAKRKPATGDEAGLLSAIRADVDDDTPRLVYADWLDENGDAPRAEFIRVQCQLARCGEFDAERLPLTRRESQLLTEPRKKAWGELPVKPIKERAFRRGFVDRVSLNADTFLAGADALFGQVPVRTVRPLNIWDAWDDLLASPHLARARGLDLHNSTINRKDAVRFFGCQHLSKLHELNLGKNGTFRGDGLRALLASQNLGSLRRLDLNDCAIDDAALAALVGCKRLPNLRHLNLCRNNITAAGAVHIARAEWLSQLEHLELSYNPLGDEGVRLLAESPVWAGHRSLSLRYVDVTAEGLRHLLRSQSLRNVIELHISMDDDASALLQIAESPSLPSLSALTLEAGQGTDEAGVAALAQSPLAPRLRVLFVGTRTAGAFNDLFRAQTLSGLEWLTTLLDHTQDRSQLDLTRLLREAKHLTNLHSFTAWANPLTDRDMQVLAGCAHLGRLVQLYLATGAVTAAGVEAFIASPHFTRLASLQLPYYLHRADDPLRARLAERFGEGVYSDF